ncbi:MAG: hypothetical protein K6E97_07815 [Treponema sp.]|nr:hypothetical protein [Treponema sp.]
MKKIKIILMVLSFLFLVQCKNTIFTDCITFTLPQWPPEDSSVYPELAFWKITICADNKTVVKKHLPQTKELDFTIKKNSLFCITALPITYIDKNYCSFFNCAGAVYPFMKNHSDIISVTWEQGFAAAVIESLYCGSTQASDKEMFLKSFNWPRFLDEINCRENYNPWLCDKTRIITAIADKNFNINLLNQKNFTINSDLILPERLLSQYIPENQKILETGQICVSKQMQNFFSSQNLCIIINGDSDKNYSADYIFMPIYIEDL